MTSLFAGIDIGTTSTKVILLAEDGTPRHQAARGYALHTPEPGYAEQDPEAIFEAVVGALAEAVGCLQSGEIIEGVAFSCAMHSLLLLDARKQPLTPSITWADARSAPQAARLRDSDVGRSIYGATGTPIHPMTPLCKLLWYKERAPDLLRACAHVISIKEYVFLRFFGILAVDRSIASATGLFDIFRKTWFEPALEGAGIDGRLMSDHVSTSFRLPSMRPEIARRTGLAPDTPCFAGASDGCLANLGVYALRPDQAALTIGTSGAIRVTVPEPATDPAGRLFTYILDERRYVTGGSINNGGILLQWFRDTYTDGSAEAFEQCMAQAGALPAGSDGLIAIPYLLGERAPHWNSFDRGVFFGVRFEHTRAHFLRALMEGAAFTLRQILNAIEEAHGPAGVVHANGGFVKSPVWVQIMADVLDKPVVIRPVAEASAIGAAMTASAALGNQMEGSAFEPEAERLRRVVPNASARDTYTVRAGLFSDTYDAVLPHFPRLIRR